MLFEQEFNKLIKPNASQKAEEDNLPLINPNEPIEVQPTIIQQTTTQIISNEISLNEISDLLEKESRRYSHRLDINNERSLAQ